MLFSFPILLIGQDFSCDEITQFRKSNDTATLNQIDTPYYKVSDVQECLCLNKQFGKYFKSNQQPNKSILFFHHGLDQLKPSTNEHWRAKGWLYADIAFAHRNSWNNVQTALDYYLLAYNILVDKLQLSDKHIAGALMTPIGNIYTSMGEFDRASIYLNQALQYFSDHGPIRKEADILFNLGKLYLTSGQYPLAIKTIKKGLFLEDIEPTTRIYFLLNLAETYNYALLPDSTLHYANIAVRALAHTDAIGIDNKLYFNAEIYQLQALAQAQLHRPQQANKLFNKGIKLKEQLVTSAGDRVLANMRLNYARYLFETDSVRASLKQAQKVIASFASNINPSNEMAVPILSDYKVERDLAHALELKADCLFKLHRESNKFEFLSAAIKHYELAFEVWDEVRAQYRYDASNLFVLSGRKSTLAQAIHAALRAYEQGHDPYFDVAYRFNTRSKNPLLIENLRKKEAYYNNAISDSIQQKLQALNANVVRLEAQVYRYEGSTNFDRVDSLRWEIMHSKNGLEAIEDEIERAHLQDTAAKNGSSQLNTEMIQSRLKDDQTLIDYFLADSVLIAFKINKHQKEVIRIHHIEHLEHDIEFLCKTIYNSFYESSPSTTDAYKKQQAAYCLKAHELHNKLITPLGKLTNQLIIVPDGNLSNLPFSVLLKSEPNLPSNYQSLPYLIRDHIISYSYSGLLWHQHDQEATSRSHTLLMAPSFKSNAVRFADATDYRRNNLGPLAFNMPEVESIHGLTGGTILTGQSATIDTFMKIASNYSIIHLATHAKLEEHNNAFSYIAFTPQDDDQIKYKLHLNQLANLNTQLDMVVLSACETGLGEIHKGEGVSTLARGFAYGGSKSMITTLWQVNGQATSEIMISFYEYLKAGHTKDDALRRSKLDYIDIQVESHFAHPYYWAGFVAIGDMSPIEFNGTCIWNKMNLFIILILFLLSFIAYRYYTGS